MDTPTTTPTTLDRFRTAAEPLTAVIDKVPANRWDAASPCEGWATRDVVRHVIETERAFLAGQDLPLGDTPDIDADPAAAWHAHRAEVEAVIADESVTGTAYDGHFGPTTIGETIERFYVFDLVAHRWDIATAAGLDERFTEAELDQLEAGAAGFGDALYMEGVSKPALDVPEGADRQTRVLAILGRRG